MKSPDLTYIKMEDHATFLQILKQLSSKTAPKWHITILHFCLTWWSTTRLHLSIIFKQTVFKVSNRDTCTSLHKFTKQKNTCEGVTVKGQENVNLSFVQCIIFLQTMSKILKRDTCTSLLTSQSSCI